jgi:protein-tyrosine phosphatase
VESAGLGALVDWPASEQAEVLMRDRGIDISSHRARQLTPQLIHDADLILVMESGHKKAIEAENATARGKVFRLGEWRDTDIDDPFRKSKAAYEQALALIDNGVTDWVERLKT